MKWISDDRVKQRTLLVVESMKGGGGDDDGGLIGIMARGGDFLSWWMCVV